MINFIYLIFIILINISRYIYLSLNIKIYPYLFIIILTFIVLFLRNKQYQNIIMYIILFVSLRYLYTKLYVNFKKNKTLSFNNNLLFLIYTISLFII
jgi:hypothetical protein